MISNVQFTTKEKLLLEDAKSHEEQCIRKYANYSCLTCDEQLRAVFQSNGSKEEEHLDTINQLLSGSVPSMGGQGQASPAQQKMKTQSNASGNPNLSDKDMCTDMLNTEKYVSGSYNTAIFEFRDAQVRDVLNHIQKEEQKHGEAIFKYMESKGMYSSNS